MEKLAFYFEAYEMDLKKRFDPNRAHIPIGHRTEKT
jgi:hypothetical protein